MEYPEKIVNHLNKFPGIPPFCQNLLDRIGSQEIDFSDLVEQIKYDPGLTANILRIANSAYYGAVRSVDSLHSALIRLGTNRVYEVIISSVVAPMMVHSLPGYRLQSEDLLRHSIWVAVACEELARRTNDEDSHLAFTAGLLHDLGKLSLDPFISIEQRRLEYFPQGEHVAFDEREAAVFGMDHCQTGAMALHKWHLPYELIIPIRWHHQPDKADGHKNLVDIVHLADILSYSQGVGAGIDGMLYRVCPESERRLGLRHYDIEMVASATLEKMEELQKLLE